MLTAAYHWDAKTRGVVLDRVANVPPIRFFTEQEARTLGAFCDVVTGQDAEPRIPVLEMVDAKLHAGRLDGFRHHDMPPDPETWQQVAANLDDSAREHGSDDGFAAAGSEMPARDRAAVLRRQARLGAARHEGVGSGDARRARRVLLTPLGVE